MPDSWDYQIVAVRRKDDGALAEKRRKLLSKFPENSLENLPIDFISRCAMDGRSEFQGCVVLCYANGDAPTAIPSLATPKTYPTYKGMQGKKVSAIGKFGSGVKKGSVVIQECKNIYCVHQGHLALTQTVIDNGARAAATYKQRADEGYYEPSDE